MLKDTLIILFVETTLGVIKDYIDRFSSYLSIHKSFYIELMTIILVIKICVNYGYGHLKLERAYTLVC